MVSSARSTCPSAVSSHRPTPGMWPPLPTRAWSTTLSTEPTHGSQEDREPPSERGPSRLAWAETVLLS